MKYPFFYLRRAGLGRPEESLSGQVCAGERYVAESGLWQAGSSVGRYDYLLLRALGWYMSRVSLR